MAGDLSGPTISSQVVVWQPPAGRIETSTSKDDDPTHKATTTLTDLPAELRNYIFELNMPSDTAICLCVERLPTLTGKLHYRFRPSLPALYQTCKQLRIDYPIARYFANNNFFITDAMLNQLKAVSAFVGARKFAADSIRKLRIDHSIMGESAPVSFRIRYTLDATLMRPGHIAVQRKEGTVMHSRIWRYAFPSDDEVVCLCGVQAATAGRHSLLELLSEYAAMLATRTRSEGKRDILGEKCSTCGNMRFV